MDDLTLATLISLLFTGLFGMGVGFGLCFMRMAKQVKALKGDLSRRNIEHINNAF